MARVSKEVVDEIDEFNKNWATCSKCGDFTFLPDEVFFDDHGTGYSTKLTHCPNCGKIVVVKHLEDYGFSKLNTDRRYF
jgi:ribosomal protein S27AE